MTRPVAVLRPEPGNAATAARVEAAGLAAVRRPLFKIVPLVWQAPDPAGFDALLLTSANAMRHGGNDLARLVSLPVIAVGQATAAAARAAGFTVTMTGDAGVAALATGGRLLHLAGREHESMPGATTIAVYAADPAPVSPEQARELGGSICLIHSARAAERLGEIVDTSGVPRGAIVIAALSEAVAQAAGGDWAVIAFSATPRDDALVALAAQLAVDHPVDPATLGADKRRQ